MAAGAQAYLTKPVELYELHHTVVQLVEQVGATT
jgi:CheY-like chemotaxis protein